MSRFRTVHFLVTTLVLAAPVACGDGDGFGGTGGSGGDPVNCCEAACVSQAGSFSLEEAGQPVAVMGTASVVVEGTGTVLFDGELQGYGLPTALAESELAELEGQTVDVLVSIDADGYAPFEDTFSLSFERVEICCSTCTAANDMYTIELVPES